MKKLIHLSMLVLIVLQSFSPAIDALARESALESASLAGLAVAQEESTAIPMVTGTLTPTPTPTDEFEPTPTGTPEPPTPDVSTGSTTDSATPELTPTLTEEPLEGETQNLGEYQILLTANPEFITPGGRVNLEWQVSGEGLEDLDLVFILPYGAALKSDKKSDMPESVYRIPAEEEKGRLQLDISREAEMPVLIQAFLLPQDAGEDFYAGPAPLAGAHIALIEKVNVNKRGGKIAGLNGKVKVDFSDGALAENAEVFIHRPLPESMPPHSLSGQPFEIKARSAKDGKGISTFGDEVRIEVDYSYLGLDEAYAADLALYWYNEDSQEWEILPSYANTETRTLHASTTHFTVFDVNIHNWQASRLPTLDSFQVSNFTGAGTFSLPIEVPPGPGGLQPGLALSYSSQVVDQSLSTNQASWVGMGWSLDTGMIERNTKGTTGNSVDDTFFLTLNGVSSMLIRDETGYHLADENFWKIERLSSPDSWVVWDKVGNTYYFEYRAIAKYFIGRKNNDPKEYCGKLEAITYQWHLTRVRNIYGKELTYTYNKETKTYKYDDYAKNSSGVYSCRTVGETPTDTAVYPNTIIYPHGRYRVRFELADRNDYKLSWATNGAHESFMRKRLSNIYVEQDSDGNGSFETVIRRYAFVYAANNDPNLVWPGITWSAGGNTGKTSTLIAVREYGLGGAQTLPEHTFTYGDHMHLTRAENGYGGAVEFEYEAWISDKHAPRYNTVLDLGYRGDNQFLEDIVVMRSCQPAGDSQWIGAFQSQGSTWCDWLGGVQRYNLNIRGTVVSSTHETQSPQIRPGGFYRVSGSIAANGNTISYGFWDGVEQYWQPVPGSNVFHLPAGRSKAEVMINAAGTSNWSGVSWVKLELVPAFYRVTQKRVYDGRGNEYPFAYTYEGATVNHSDLVEPTAYCPLQTSEPNRSWLYKIDTSCREFTLVNSQFRGDGQVTETGPNGLKTVTQYYQDDVRKGRPISVTVKDSGDNLLSQQLFTYASSIFPYSVNAPRKADCSTCPPYKGLFGAWVRTVAQENRVYASDGSYSATRTAYTYEETYGNQVAAQSQVWNGSDWVAHIRTETNYFPNTNGVYLVGLPGRTRQLDAGGNVLGSTLFLYDGRLGGFQSAPTQGILTAVRSRNTGFSQVSYTYDGWGNRVSQTMWSTYGTADTPPSGDGRSTTTQYDPLYGTYPISSTNPLNQTVTWTYNYSLGVPLSETDPNGAVTSAAYDVFGRMTQLIRPGDDSDDPSIKIDYFDTASPFRIEISQRVADSHYLTLRRYYDGMGRQFKTETGNTISGSFSLFNTTQTLFDSPTVTRQSLPFGPNETPVYSTSETRYENGKKISEVTSPDGSSSSSVVDGLTTSLTDPAGRTTTSLADAWGRTVSVTPPDGPAVNYTYDILGRLLTATRGGATTKIKYDMAGRKIGMDDPDMGTAGTLDDDNWGWTYTYDALGNLTGQTDARGCTLTLTYDLLNRLTAKNSSGAGCGTQVSSAYTYDAGPNGKGRRTGMSDASTGSGSTTWAYDARGRVTIENKRIGSQIYTTQWTYNSADLPLTMTYPDGEVVTNTYDANLLLKSVVGASTYLQSTTYDFTGRMTERMLGNGLSQTYNYYAWNQQGGRLQSLTTTGLQNLSYQYDLVGNITQIQDSIATETQTFGYDALDRLTGWTLVETTRTTQETYTYDLATGNLASKAGTALLYGDTDHAHAATAMGGNTYTYDANGNQITRSIANDGQNNDEYELLYDAENRLVEVKKDSATIAKFVFDGDGKRVIGIENGKTVHYIGGHYEVDVSDQTQENVSIPVTSFDADPAWQAQATSPGTWLWKSNWWGAYSGTANYLISNNVHGELISEPIAVAPNTQYTLSGWIRGEINEQEGEGGWIIRAVYYDANDQYLDFTDAAFGGGAGVSTSWAQKSGLVTTPPGAASVRIFLYFQLSSGWVSFDDISFKQVGATTELVADPGFELGTGWTASQYSPVSFLWRVGWGQRSGAYAYTITNNAYGHLTSNQIAVTPNTQYVLAGWVRGELDDTQGEGGWIIRAAYYDATGQFVGFHDISGSGLNLSPAWSSKIMNVSTPANAVSARIFLYQHLASGWVAFDDISFKKSRTTIELVEDPGFELGTSWTTSQVSPATWFWRGGVAESSPRTGSYAYAITNMVYGSLTSKLTPITSGAQYDVSAWVRGEIKGYQSSGGFIMRVNAYDADGQYLSYTDLAASYLGNTLTPAWQQLVHTYTPPAGAAYIRVLLYNHRASGWVAFDELSVKKTGTTTELLSDPGFEESENTPVNTTSISEAYPALPSALHNVTLKISGQESDPNAVWRIRAIFYDASEQVISSQDVASQATHSLGPVAETVATLLTSPAGTDFVKFELHVNFASGWASFDEIVFSPVGATTKYYFAGASRVAMRTCSGVACLSPMAVDDLAYILGDHLGSTSLTTDASGVKTSEMRYSPWGETRYTWTKDMAPGLPSRYTFTGQYSYMDDPTTTGREGFGLMFYNARWYDVQLGRFAQADSIIPEAVQGTQAWDRYAYVNNNPIKYNDPTGHCPWCIGAAIGAVAGGIIGAVTYAMTNQGKSLDYKEMAVAAGVGAVSGALIGSGIGLVAGAVAASGSAVTLQVAATAVASASSTATPLVAAGVASGVTEIQYMVDNPGEFESDPFLANAGISGITAFASAKTKDPLSKIAIEAGGAGIAYLATVDPENFYWEDFGASVGVGVAGGVLDAGLGFGLEEVLWITALQRPLVNAAQGLVTGTVVGNANNFVQNIIRSGRTEEMR